MPRRRVLREVAALVVVDVEVEGRIGGVIVVVVVGESNGGLLTRSPLWRFTFTMSRGLPMIMPAAPET